MTFVDKEDILGVGWCKNVSVSISQRFGESGYSIKFRLASEFLPADFEFSLDSFDYLVAILKFLDAYIGTDKEGSYTCAGTETSRIRISKDAKDQDRFSFFLSAPGVIVSQVFGGISSASLLKALVLAVGEVSSEKRTRCVNLNT